MPNPIFFDTETCGLHGPVVLIQWAEGDGPINLHEVWTTPIVDTLKLIEKIALHPDGVVGFNLTFDWFHLCQLYTTLLLMPDHQAYPEDCIEQYALLEPKARLGPCLKPVSACDLMLVARKGPYQSTMNRGDIRIRRVPTSIAWDLADELEKRIHLSDIYFARRKNKNAKKWVIYDIEDELGNIDTRFKDIALNFSPSSALKVLAVDALNLPVDTTLLFADIDIDPVYHPEELGFAPFALAIGKPGNWKKAWPEVIAAHIRHWAFGKLARQYAEKDVEYTRALYIKFGSPKLGDDDSELACMVGAVRWKGFNINPPGFTELRQKALIRKGKYPTAPAQAKKYIYEMLDPTEQLILKGTTKKTVLEEIASWTNIPCSECDGKGILELTPTQLCSPTSAEELFESFKFENSVGESGDVGVECPSCKGKGVITHPAAVRASHVIDARTAGKELELYDKLLTAGRLHADFVVIGTLSSRMAGAGGLNAQGIKRDKEVRSQFPLADADYQLCGGDFAGFEVVLAEACYNDPDLRRDIQTKRPCHKCVDGKMVGGCKCNAGYGLVDGKICLDCYTPKELMPKECSECDREAGKLCDKCKKLRNPNCDECRGTLLAASKIHALFGQFVYPHMSYEQILKNKEIYTRCKSAVFAMLYGGEAYTLKERLGVPIETAEKAYEQFTRRYPGVAISRRRITEMFSALKQTKEFGKIEWSEPAEYIESMFGFRRYFTLENTIIRALYDLANAPPKHWKLDNVRVQRDKRNPNREQSAVGATQSALFGAAFALQSSNIRAAANHEIQSSGATITKKVQRDIWDIQPSGINDWIVQPMNVHDEIMSPTRLDYVDRVKQVVNSAVESFRSKIPLIEMEWDTTLTNWADK